MLVAHSNGMDKKTGMGIVCRWPHSDTHFVMNGIGTIL